jgi:hypothetical protein
MAASAGIAPLFAIASHPWPCDPVHIVIRASRHYLIVIIFRSPAPPGLPGETKALHAVWRKRGSSEQTRWSGIGAEEAKV